MAARLGAEAAARLAASGATTVDTGLTDAEVDRVEELLGFTFADDHRTFLAAGLPVGAGWPDWRNGGRRALQRALQMPRDGVLFDVECNDFWFPDWGPRPARMKDALRSANYHLARAPQLVPVHSHRYLPAGRGSFGQPVLSVVQTDVIVYGADLAAYVEREFGGDDSLRPAVDVEFWSDLVR